MEEVRVVERNNHSLDSASGSRQPGENGQPSTVESRHGAGSRIGGQPGQGKPAGRPLFRRRQYLIDRRGQLLATARVSGLVLVLLALVNVVFALWNQMETQAIVALNPQLMGEMADIDLRMTLVLATVSFVLLVFVMIRTIVLTHRTAGAVFNLRRCVDRVAAGDYGTRVRMRRKDTLWELQEPFNQMMDALQQKAADNRAALSNLAGKIEELDRNEIANEIRRLADAAEELADSRS
jgi:methyl-accepting chemotaxis protein